MQIGRETRADDQLGFRKLLARYDFAGRLQDRIRADAQRIWPSYAAHAGLSSRPPIGARAPAAGHELDVQPARQPVERAGLGAVGKVSGDGVGNSVSQCRLDQRHPRGIVARALLAGAQVATELDRFSKRSLGPSDRSGVNCRHRREVGGLWLGLHGPSVVVSSPQTVGSVAACRCP